MAWGRRTVRLLFGIVLALGGIGVVAVLIGFSLGLLPSPYEPPGHLTEWPALFNYGMLVVGFSALLAVIVALLVASLQTSLSTTGAALDGLGRVNASLEDMVERRTRVAYHAAALLGAAQRVAGVGGCIYDPVSGQIEWTDELYRIHEVPPDTPLDLKLFERLYPGTSSAALVAAFHELRADSAPYERELPALTLGGR